MKKYVCIFLSLLLATLTVFAHDQSERDKSGLKGKVKTVENYEIVFGGPEDSRTSGTRNLSGLSMYNKKGDLLERWLLTNDANGSYYERQVYTYDKDHRKKTAIIYKSDKTERDKYFSLGRTALGSLIAVPSLNERIYRKTSYRYGTGDRFVEEINTDDDGKFVERRISEFDSSGNLIKVMVANADGPVYESLTLYLDNGRRSETTDIRNNSEIQRSVIFLDEKGSFLQIEQYVNSPIDGSNDKKKFVLHNIMTYTHTRGRMNSEWKFFKPNGDPESKLVMVQEHGEEISRELYKAEPLPPGSQNENIDATWIAGTKTYHKHIFDNRGNLIQHTWLEQKTPNSPLFQVYFFENVITYY